MELEQKGKVPKYEVNDVVTFDQGKQIVSHAGTGKIMFAQDYPLCYAYSIKMTDGPLVQVLEQHITGVVHETD